MAVTGAIGAVATALASAGTGIAQHQASIKSRRQQRQAQQEATAQAVSQQRKADEALAEANRKAPDATSLLTAEQQERLRGPSTSLLTGQGTDPNRLKLGRVSLLGS